MLDRTRHYSEIFGGEPKDGAHFIQDGIRYGADDLEVAPKKVAFVPKNKAKPKADAAELQ